MVDAKAIANLNDVERNELERLLMEFDEGWAPDLLAKSAHRLSQDGSEEFRHLVTVELIKIDIHRRWATGTPVTVEEYLEEFPSSSTLPASVVELLMAEFQARRLLEPQLEVSSFQSRFPDHYPLLCQAVAESGDSIFSMKNPAETISTSHAKASVETSRVAHPGKHKHPQTKPSLPETFGRYKIIRELGSGAMGAVYLAHDTQLDRQVALKTPSFSGGKDHEMIARFYLEARAAAKIHHRNICPIHDVGEINGRHFISMAYVRGRSMSEYINPNKLPPFKACAALIQRLADAMAEAHRHNVIHRDLKPSNIMIDTKREPVVMDFGLARQTDSESRMTQSGMIVGTPAYMSPEQVTGNSPQVTPAVDIYALGVILYELLTGQLPFRGTISQVIYKITYEEPVHPSEIRARLDLRLESICLKMMAKKVEDRYSSMEEVSSDLKAYLQQRRVAATDKKRSRSQESVEYSESAAKDRDSRELTETEAINGFLAATSSQQAKHTVIESAPGQLIDTSSDRKVHRRTKPQSSRCKNRSLFQAGMLAGGLALIFGVIIVFKGGKVELDESSNAVVDIAEDGSITITPEDPEPKRPTTSTSNSQSLWINLFDGKTLDGWSPVGENGWRIEDNTIVGTTAKRKHGWLRSDETFDDFDLELEYRLSDASNSGVFLRAKQDGDIHGKGLLEIQLLDDTATMFANIVPVNRTGSLHGHIAASPSLRIQPNQWHTLSVILEGEELQVSIDSQKVVSGKIPPGYSEAGHIGLQLYDSKVQFRNIRVKELTKPLSLAGNPRPELDSLSEGATRLEPKEINAANFEKQFTIQNEGGGNQFAVSPDGLQIVTTGSGSPGRFTFWDLRTQEVISQFTDPAHAGMGTRDLQFSPDGTHILYVINKFVKVLNLKTQTIEQEYEFPAKPMLVVFPKQTIAAVIHYEREIHQRDRARVPQRLRILNWASGEEMHDQAMEFSRNISITPDEKFLFRSRENYHVRHAIEWDGATLTLGRGVQFEKTSRTRSQLTFSPDGRYAANSIKSKSGMAVMLDVATARIVRYLEPELARSNNESHEYGASVAFSSDGSQIITANHLGRIALWDCESGDLVREITKFTKSSNHWAPRMQVSSRGQLFIGMNPIEVWGPGSQEVTELSADEFPQGEDDRQTAQHIVRELNAAVDLADHKWTWKELPAGEIRVKGVFFQGEGGRLVSDQDLVMLQKLKNLESIDFGQTAITSDGFRSLTALKTLKKLSFSVEALTDDVLARLSVLPLLESIELLHTDVTDDGLKTLAHFPALRYLSLSVSPKQKFGPAFLTDDCLRHLDSITRLEQLSLFGPSFTDAGIEHLLRLDDLDCIRIWAPNITDSGIQKLREHLPECEIMDKR
ncbi:Serine/threonine-protein kinase PrkC [Thalassoglobus neptunius]|uniref:non-specific serine/threonine protein kinase n=1 Tax=Thalassoglobus neptunius TaxID=1938619 RepID=A0A5C5VR70_9PLAN|nr:family 16 glycoside hydrolase [Thalassoglobus neptunius]TWT40052.1 Serine/threonine-protein kinase PrkC [Thalassoglobus neptunius]